MMGYLLVLGGLFAIGFILLMYNIISNAINEEKLPRHKSSNHDERRIIK